MASVWAATRRVVTCQKQTWNTGLSRLPFVRFHNLGRGSGRQSCCKKLVDSPTLLLDEICDQQAIARITAVLDSCRRIVRPVTQRVTQLLERLPVRYADIIGQSFPRPLRHQIASYAKVLISNDMGKFVGTQISKRAWRRPDISPVDDSTSVEIGAGQEGVASERIGVLNAPGVGMREEEQSLSPVRVCNVDPVFAPLRFKRGSLKQFLAVMEKMRAAHGWYWAVGSYRYFSRL